MSRKEFVKLIEANIWAFEKLADTLRVKPEDISGYPRQQMSVLVRLHQGGRAMLKDIARREHVSTPNLCAAFRKLERDGLVVRTMDEDDRRNTWYVVSPAGAKMAERAMDLFRASVEKMFVNISRADEVALTNALRTMHSVLTKLEEDNA